MNLCFLPATLPLWAKLAVPVAMIVLPGGFLIPAVWLAIDRLRAASRGAGRPQPALDAAPQCGGTAWRGLTGPVQST